MKKARIDITPLVDYMLVIWLMMRIAEGGEEEIEKVINSGLYKSLITKYEKKEVHNAA